MSDMDDIKSVLCEIRDLQRQSLDNQAEHIMLSRQQLERAKTQVDESLKLQKKAMARHANAIRMVKVIIPLIVLCLIVLTIITFL